MIQSEQFNLHNLVNLLLDIDLNGDSLGWRGECEIITDYRHPNAKEHQPSRCVVRLGKSFLRHSCGPHQHHFWDIYGDDYQTPELALLALSQAPPPYMVIQDGLTAAMERIPGCVEFTLSLRKEQGDG